MSSNQQFNGLTIKASYPVDNEYLFNYCSQLKNKLIEIAGVTTFPFVSVAKLGSIMISIPPIQEQKRIIEKIDSINKIIDC